MSLDFTSGKVILIETMNAVIPSERVAHKTSFYCDRQLERVATYNKWLSGVVVVVRAVAVAAAIDDVVAVTMLNRMYSAVTCLSSVIATTPIGSLNLRKLNSNFCIRSKLAHFFRITTVSGCTGTLN